MAGRKAAEAVRKVAPQFVMESHVFAAVLLAAVLHAGWNSALKVGLDRVSAAVLLALVQAMIAIPLLPFVPRPSVNALPWILASAALHVGYKLCLVQAYARSDLSVAYPLARGSAPLIVAAWSLLFLGAAFPPRSLAAILVISSGVLLLAAKGRPEGRMSGRALFWALGTAGFTAGYTLVDGTGARIAGTASGYILWMVIGDAVGTAAFAALLRGCAAFPALLRVWRTGLAAGAMSLASYWIAIWAFTQAPIALVAALRESSILFATVIAALALRERVTRWRWLSAGAIACGVVLMKM